MPSLLDWGGLFSVQVHFLINNLSTANLDSKSETLKDVLPREFWPWFSNYMVVKRAAQVRSVDLYGVAQQLLSAPLDMYHATFIVSKCSEVIFTIDFTG